MSQRSYQRRYLRAPFREPILYADGDFVHKARALNISENGLLLDQIPSFPTEDEVPLMLSLPQVPSLKNFNLYRMQTFAQEIFPSHVVRVRARIVRREELSQNLDNIFRAKVGVQFTKISPRDQKSIEEYVSVFAANLIHLQALIDSFNSDESSRELTRRLATILGYKDVDKIAQLRVTVGQDYKSLQWL